MTPPDSDVPKKHTPEEWRKLAEEEWRGTEQGLAFLDAVERDGCMARVKPDSDARDVLHETWCASKVPDHECDCPATKRITIHLSLAQRILAALEDPDGHGRRWSPRALAASLRAQLPKEPK